MTDSERLIKLLQNPEVQEAITKLVLDAFAKCTINLVGGPYLDPSLVDKIAESLTS